VGSRPDRPDFFLKQKRSSAGEISKNSKNQGWRGGSAFGWQTAGLAQVFSWK